MHRGRFAGRSGGSVDGYCLLRRPNQLPAHNPDNRSSALTGSGTDVTVTVRVPVGVDVARGRMLVTLPDVINVPVARGSRENEKKSAGNAVVKRSS
jgi:hypothetical protein